MQVPYLIEITYLIASILFIYGLKALSHPKTARTGMNAAGAGMLLAIVGTLLNQDIISFEWIIIESIKKRGRFGVKSGSNNFA